MKDVEDGCIATWVENLAKLSGLRCLTLGKAKKKKCFFDGCFSSRQTRQ